MKTNRKKQTDHYKTVPLYHFAPVIKKAIGKTTMQTVIFGNFGSGNYGDEAILAGELKELQKEKGFTVTVVSRFPKQLRRIHNVNSIGIGHILSIVRLLLTTDVVIFGGGGLICKNDSGIRGIAYQLYALCMFLLLPLLLGKRVYVLGIGIYNNSNPVIVSFARYLFSHASGVTVRDEHSYAYLQKKIPNVLLKKDNSFLMDTVSAASVSKEQFFKNRYDKNAVNIGFALKKPADKKEAQKLLHNIGSFIQGIHLNAHVWFYPLETHGSADDTSFIHEIIASLPKASQGSGAIHIVPDTLTPRVLFSSFLLMDYIVAMRLHAMIFAYRLNVPFIGIPYDEKCRSFLSSIGVAKREIKNISQGYLTAGFTKAARLARVN